MHAELPGWLWAGLSFLQRYLVPLCFPASLFSLQNGAIMGSVARRLFLYCGIGACRVVSNLEIAGIADSKQNRVSAVYRNLAQPLKLQSNPPPRLLFLIKHA